MLLDFVVYRVLSMGKAGGQQRESAGTGTQSLFPLNYATSNRPSSTVFLMHNLVRAFMWLLNLQLLRVFTFKVPEPWQG